jgi:hypothetical protein
MRARSAPVRLLFSLSLLVGLALACCEVAATANAATNWAFEPALAPPPPPGVQAAPYPVALGNVGDIEFWAPNRGLLITAGNAEGNPVPMGLYAYDGRSWHQLSTVCGGTDGRIAWAGSDEFWTIADQRAGQIVAGGAGGLLADVSLCHFQDGQVVGSYALPLDQPESYLTMNAAACLTPSNCWFGGKLGQYPNKGSFHLHWDGTQITTVYDTNSRDDHAISSMASYKGALYEGVELARTDEYGGATASETPIVHSINANSSDAFGDVPLTGTLNCGVLCTSLPEYGNVDPTTLGGFLISSDAGLSGSSPSQTQMWMVAGRSNETFPSSETIHPLLLRCGNDNTFGEGGSVSDCGSDVWAQAPTELLPAGERVAGLAAEPGGDSAWVSLQQNDEAVHVDRVTLSERGGRQTAEVNAQDTLGLGGKLSEYGDRGNGGPIACPAANDCWLATDQGWLYHFDDGAALPRDADPSFAGVITYRPPDAGIPQLIADAPPPDDSLANQQPPPPPAAPQVETAPMMKEPLVLRLHSRVIHRYTLQLSFTLAAAAHVQLLARRDARVVARTPRKLLKAGKIRLSLRLDPRRWPTKLDLQAIPLHPLPLVPANGTKAGGSSASGPGSSSVST